MYNSQVEIFVLSYINDCMPRNDFFNESIGGWGAGGLEAKGDMEWGQ